MRMFLLQKGLSGNTGRHCFGTFLSASSREGKGIQTSPGTAFLRLPRLKPLPFPLAVRVAPSPSNLPRAASSRPKAEGAMAAVPKGRARSPPLPPPPPAVFYGPLEPGNPVLDSFESDLRHCLGCLRRKRDAEGNESAKEQELHRRG